MRALSPEVAAMMEEGGIYAAGVGKILAGSEECGPLADDEGVRTL